MINILLIFCCLIAAYIIYSSGTGAVGMATLIQEDTNACPEDFLPAQTCGRRTVMLNEMCRTLAAGSMLVYGVNALSGNDGCELFLATPAGLAAATAVLCLASLAAIILNYVKGFTTIREDIMTVWKKEKRVSARHDDEVRLYRILGDVTGIPAKNARMVVYMACMYGLSLIA